MNKIVHLTTKPVPKIEYAQADMKFSALAAVAVNDEYGVNISIPSAVT